MLRSVSTPEARSVWEPPPGDGQRSFSQRAFIDVGGSLGRVDREVVPVEREGAAPVRPLTFPSLLAVSWPSSSSSTPSMELLAASSSEEPWASFSVPLPVMAVLPRAAVAPREGERAGSAMSSVPP